MISLPHKIIDIHAHVGDLLYGQPLDEPYREPVRTIADFMERSGFRLNKPPGLGSSLTRYFEIIHIHHRNNLATADNLRRYSQPYGVTHSVLQPVEPVLSTEFTMAAAARENTPDHNFLTFASVDPRDPEKLGRLEKYMSQGCLGLKLHPVIQNTPATDPRYFELAEAMRKYKKPILIHTGRASYYIPRFKRSEYGAPETFEKLIAAFPDVLFILAHMNTYAPEKVWSLARKYSNVFADASFQPAKSIREAFNQMGTDRVLFGSDFPFTLPQYAIKVGRHAVKDNSVLKEKFFFRNAEALIGELPWPESWKAITKE